jgi:hypothetical protein
MKRLTLISLIIALLTSATAQVLPVWNVLSPVIQRPYDGDTIDGKYAALPYVDVRKWPEGVLKYNALRTIKATDHWTLRVYAKIPKGCYFYITAQKDTSTFSVLYEYKNPVTDNQQSEPIDTVLQVDDKYNYGGEFYRFAIVRYWHMRETQDTMYIDALVLEMLPPKDTIITEHDDTVVVPSDTILSSVGLMPKPVSVWKYFNILGFETNSNCDNCIAIDQFGRKRWIRR